MLCSAETSVTPLQEDGKLEVTPEGCFLTSTCASWHDSSYIHMNTHKQTHAHIQKEIKTESFFLLLITISIKLHAWGDWAAKQHLQANN